MVSSIFSKIYTYYYAARVKTNITNVDLILPNSKWLQKKVNETFPNRPTRLFYVGITAKKWEVHPKETFPLKHPAVAAIFFLNNYQKLAGLLKFMKVVRMNFYVAGDGCYRRLVESNSPPNLHLVGKLSGDEVKSLLNSCDVFAHPSSLDALPRTVKEASLLEKPIVASNIGGIPEIVKDNQTGYLCDVDDTNQWVDRIRFMLDNPSVAQQFGKNARRYVVETFDWQKIAVNFLDILRDWGSDQCNQNLS
jgi:glycosyltransferase involved in cell wall biosynthesis